MKYLYKENVSYYYNKFLRKSLFFKKAKKFDDKFYSKLTNIVYGNMTIGEFIKTSSTMSCCYFYATVLARNLENSVLCMGTLKNLDCIDYEGCEEKFMHAWVEYGNYVLDTTAKCVFNKEYFYKLYDPNIEKTFSNITLQDDLVYLMLGIMAIKNREYFIPGFKDVFMPIYENSKSDERFADYIQKYLNENKRTKTFLEKNEIIK